MTPIADIHTHRPGPAAILNIEPGQPIPAQPYSAGIHPWHLHTATPARWELLDSIVRSSQCLAIGETGFDPNAVAPMPQQTEAFRRHVQLSEDTGKPLIIHCVRSLDPLLRMRRMLRPSAPWIWHGFRGSAQMAAQLRRHGIYYSFGPRFNAAAVAATPVEELLIETDDDGTVSIAQVAARVAAVKGIDPALVLNNAKTFVNL